MAISKKGLRTIIVDGNKFFWKFNEKIFIQPFNHTNGLLIVDFGWYDVWCFSNKELPPDFEPKITTPKFVSNSIIFALNNGWKNDKLEIEFQKGSFKVKMS